MQIGDLAGKLVLFKFSEEIRIDLPLFQIYKDEVWAAVTGVDNEGIWIENSAYELGVWWDEKGDLIPPNKQVKEKVKTNILIPWLAGDPLPGSLVKRVRSEGAYVSPISIWEIWIKVRIGKLVETAAYYDNPFEYWAYRNDGRWEANSAQPALKWGSFKW